MNAPLHTFAGLAVDEGLFGRRGFRIGLLVACAIALLLVWILPSLNLVGHSTRWFPVSLHTLAELFSVVVSAMVFAVTWHAFRPERPAPLAWLACGFLAASLLDVAHLLSYRGMPDWVTAAAPQKSIAFWLCARWITAITLLAIAFLPWRPFARAGERHRWLAAALGAVVLVVAAQLGWPADWPRFYVEGAGLTPIKLVLEGGVTIVFGVVLLRLWHVRRIEPPYDIEGMMTATALCILSETALMLYENVNDAFSLLGHLYKVLAYFFIYRLVFVASVREPYERLAEETARTHAAELQVEALAYFDLLTGLPNKARLRERCAPALAARAADGGHAALLLLNVDGFKTINDSVGHAAGDALLRALAARLPECVGDDDAVARIGGDEFALLLRDVADADAITGIGERIRAALAEPVEAGGTSLRVTVSVGAAISPGDGDDFEGLFQNAGTALHRAKEAGGDALRFYRAEMNREAAERLELRNALREALTRGEFELHYQPQLDLDNGALVGVEALVRWRRPGHGLVPPAQFIGEAEASDLIVPLGAWILAEACRQVMAWRAEGVGVPQVAVNLSARQFQRGDIERKVAAALEASGLPATALELELTESILVQDAAAVLAVVRRLKARGLRLSIDDFGTGYSSLAYLRDFPVDTLKVDQSFVRELGQRADGEVIVGTIIQLGRSLGLDTVAEGVEDAAAAATLRRLGCGRAQGYYYAKPMPPDAFAAWLRARSA